MAYQELIDCWKDRPDFGTRVAFTQSEWREAAQCLKVPSSESDLGEALFWRFCGMVAVRDPNLTGSLAEIFRWRSTPDFLRDWPGQKRGEAL